MKNTGRLLIFCLVSFLLQPAHVSGQQAWLTILHTNDTHGHLLPFSYPSIAPPGSEFAALKVRRDIGGIARRATLVRRIRAELAARHITVWLMDAGDFCDGTPFSTEYHGEADIAAMNAAGYDFATLGNHEFNNPLSTLKRLIGLFRFPLLCANAVETSSGKPLTQPSAIRQVGPVKIGIFGLLIREAGRYQAGKEGVTVAGEIETAQRMVRALRREADIVIALSHAGSVMDEEIARTVPGLDVIVGGHTHARLASGQFVWHSDELKEKEENGTVIVQAYQWGGELGRLDLLFTRDDTGAWHVDHHRARLIPVTAELPEDESVAAVVDSYWKPIANRYGEIIGQAEDDFSELGNDMAPYNLVADAIRQSFGTEIELENVAGVRAPLIKGKITRADMIELDPFDNKVVTFKITGRQLKEILRKTRPYVSGLRYRLENGEIRELTVAGQPVDDDRAYTGSTNTYFAEYALKGIDIVNTGKLRRDVLIDYIRAKGTVKPSYDRRRVVIPQ
ncbi:MAG TPA: bifunctional UDP-sugar hydrolase/5'-nucleotidase [Acidobacteriota bacterium]|nr:bifunctional UDP-sugar hydrolase/5'-nucleotidase [Acidobacteriota bacterium]